MQTSPTRVPSSPGSSRERRSPSTPRDVISRSRPTGKSGAAAPSVSRSSALQRFRSLRRITSPDVAYEPAAGDGVDTDQDCRRGIAYGTAFSRGGSRVSVGGIPDIRTRSSQRRAIQQATAIPFPTSAYTCELGPDQTLDGRTPSTAADWAL